MSFFFNKYQNLRVIWVILLGVLGISAIPGIPWALMEPLEWDQIGQGTRTGYVTAIDHSGVIWQTTTAYFKTDTQSTQEDNYCVRPGGPVDALRAASESHARVEVTYARYRFVDWAECHSRQSEAIVAVRDL